MGGELLIRNYVHSDLAYPIDHNPCYAFENNLSQSAHSLSILVVIGLEYLWTNLAHGNTNSTADRAFNVFAYLEFCVHAADLHLYVWNHIDTLYDKRLTNGVNNILREGGNRAS